MTMKYTDEYYAQQQRILTQYDEMKKKHPDAILLFRTGDFYEAMKEDAATISKILDITLTKRRSSPKTYMEIAGFPHHALDTYLPKLIKANLRVAICEQIEEKRKVVKRDSKNDKDMEKSTKQEEKSAEEKQPRQPQMVTVNGEKVTYGHIYQGAQHPENRYFTAKLDGKQLKPQLMSEDDVVAYYSKKLTIQDLMQKYYPTKLMKKLPREAYTLKNAVDVATDLVTDKFVVYKEKNPNRPDFGKYKFYAELSSNGKDVVKMSAVATREDLNAFFDRVIAPVDLVKKIFGERLHLESAYKKYQLPEGVDPQKIRISKSMSGDWCVSVDLGEYGKTTRAILNYDDKYSYFKAKTATKEELAAKYLGSQIRGMLKKPVEVKTETSLKI